MANRRFIDFPIASTVGDNDIVLIWQDGANKQTTKATLLTGLPEDLGDLNDVVISGLTNGQILRYNSTTGVWENTDQGNLDLTDLNDVTIVSPSNGQVLVYNGSTGKWENSSGGFVPYVGAVTTVDLGAQGLRAGYVRFDTAIVGVPQEQGVMFWDADDETVDVILNGYTMKIGEDLFYPVKNQTGSTIAKGTAVRFAGTLGASGRLLIEPFIANGTVPSNLFMGVTAEEILNGEDGKVLYFGRVRGINTDAFNEGDILYASTTVAGGYQTAIPLPPNNIVQVAAVVTKSINQGTIFVRPTLGSNINTDEGVKITSVADKNLLQYQSGTGLWENKTLAQVLGGTASQFVKGNGSLDSTSYQPLLTNPVTGTGTTNRLAKFSGASTIANSNISDGGVTILNENPTAGQFAWQFNGNTTTGQSFGASVVAGTNSSDIAFRVLNASASVTHLLVKGDGNLIVGGTSDNGARLQVSGFATISNGLQISGGPAGYGGAELVLNSASDGLNAIYTNGGGAVGMFFDHRGTSNSGYWVFRNGTGAASERLRITSSGNVGIGTTNPTEKLYIEGSTPYIVLANTEETESGITFIDTASAAQSAKITFNSGTGNNLNFYNNAASVRMSITPSGNVGIGTASPDTYSYGGTRKFLTLTAIATNEEPFLQLIANGSGNSLIDFGNATIRRATIIGFDGSHLAFYTNGSNSGTSVSERLRITSSGNCLIGTTTDNGATLQVNGGINGSTFQATNAALTVDANNEKKSGFYRWNSTSTNLPESGFFAVVIYGNGNNVVAQMATHFTNGNTYVRAFNTAWTAWKRLD